MDSSKNGNKGLVLERKLGDSVYINDNIKITVVDVQGKRVRLAFKCDDLDTRISRFEKDSLFTDPLFKGA